MSASFNKVTLVGNLVRNPEIKYIASGAVVTTFTLAVNGRNKDQDATFVDITAWNKLGEICNTYLKKGASVLVEGRLQINSYTDKENTKRKSTTVVINDMRMLGSAPKGTAAPATEELDLDEVPA